MSSNRIGSQEPRIRVLPKRDDWEELYSDGDDACALSSAYGLCPDKRQRLVITDWLKRDSRDQFAVVSCGLSLPRQNGKNAVLEMRELYGLVACGEKILHTAHRVDTARKAFLRLATFFENDAYPELKEMVVSIRRTNGQEAIVLNNGASIEFSSRVNGGARGSTYDVVVFDEAQELTNDQMEAIMSTMAAAPSGNRQLVFTGTPPSPVSPGTVFRKRRTGALSGSDTKILWHEWSVEEIGNVADRDRWYETNPALGIRLDEDFTEEEFNTLTEDGFARERLGWWDNREGGNAVFTKGQWKNCQVEKAPEKTDKEKLAYGVKFSIDGKHVALSVAIKPPEGKRFIECIEYCPTDGGITWLADWLYERKQKCAICVIDGKSYTAALERKLLDRGFPKRAIYIAAPKDVCSAATMFYNAVDEGDVTHAGQPSLAQSAIAAQKRIIGKDGGWGFGSGTFDCSLVESASLAYFGVMTTKRNPNRKMRIG